MNYGAQDTPSPMDARPRWNAVGVRSSALTCLLTLVGAWLAGLAAEFTLMWPLSVLALAVAGWGIFKDVSKDGYLHPIIVFSFFSLIVVLINVGWMAFYLDRTLLFFSHGVPVSADEIVRLAREQLILFTCAYGAYLLVRGIGTRRQQYVVPTSSTLESLWPLFYGAGLLGFAILVVVSGGAGDLLSNLGSKSERAAGSGELVALVYFAGVATLLWYKKNQWRPTWQRYGGLLVLSAPLLLTGSRAWVMIAVVAALYMDERTGRRVEIKRIATWGAALAFLFAIYAALRGGNEITILQSIYKDLSTGTGFIIALEQGLIQSETNLEALAVALAPFGTLISLLGFELPDSPNYLFTQSIFPGTTSTFSMGVMGEAGYTMSSNFTFIYYFAVSLLLAWVGVHGWKRSLIGAAVIVGVSYRIVRGGVTQGIAEAILFAIPVVLAYIAGTLLPSTTKKYKRKRR